MSPDQNSRGRRTSALLRDALAELVEERGLDAVTVGELSERADVTRTAFYRHYRDKHHLVAQIFDEATDHLAGESPGIAERLRRFFDHIADHERLFRALLGPRGSSSFTARLQGVIRAAGCAEPDTAAPEDELAVAVLGGMLTQAIVWWLDNGRPLRSDELAARCLGLAEILIGHRAACADRTDPRRT